MIRGLKSLGKASRNGKGALRVSRACLFALAFAALSNTGFAFPHNGRALFRASPARKLCRSDPLRQAAGLLRIRATAAASRRWSASARRMVRREISKLDRRIRATNPVRVANRVRATNSHRIWAHGCSGTETCPRLSRKGLCRTNQGSTGCLHRPSINSPIACGSSTTCRRLSGSAPWTASKLSSV